MEKKIIMLKSFLVFDLFPVLGIPFYNCYLMHLIMNWFILISATALILVSGCSAPQNKMGALFGHISISHVCPVEQPENPDCKPTEQTYNSYPFQVYSASGTKVAEFRGDKSGNFTLTLPIGIYSIRQDTSAPPYFTNIEIKANAATTLGISIDTVFKSS